MATILDVFDEKQEYEYFYQNPNLVIFKEPFVYTSLRDSSLVKNLKKYDSQAFPIGASVRDVERMVKFSASYRGFNFLVNQLVLQGQNSFNEVTLYNPLMPTLAAAWRVPGAGMLLGRPTRHIDLSGGVLGAFSSMIGFPMAAKKQPAGTLSALPIQNLSAGAGLQRARTAVSAAAKFDLIYNNKSTASKSIFSKLISTFAPALSSLPVQEGTYKIYDSKVYNTFLENYNRKNKDNIISDNDVYYNSSNLNHSSKSLTPTKFPQISSTSSPYSEQFKNTNKDTKTENSKLVTSFYTKYNTYPTDRTLGLKSKNHADTDVLEINAQLKNNIDEIRKQGSIKELSSLDPGFKLLKFEELQNDKNSKPFLYSDAYNKNKEDLISGKKIGFPDKINKFLDQINIKDILNSSTDADAESSTRQSDLVPLFFKDLVNEKIIQFRCIITSISDTSTSEWQDFKYMGRPNSLYIYRGFARTLAFNIKVYAGSVKELLPMWRKINYLKGLTLPSNYSPNISNESPVIVPPFVEFNLGDMYYKQPAILDSIGVSIPEEASWETTSQSGSEPYKYLNGMIQIQKDYTTTKNVYFARFPTMCDISIQMKLLEKALVRTGDLRFFGNELNEFSKGLKGYE